MKIYLEFSDGTAHKFWEITVTNESYTVRYGRIGTTGQSKTKSCDTTAAALAEARRLADAKMKSGYREIGTATTDATPTPRGAGSPRPKPQQLAAIPYTRMAGKDLMKRLGQAGGDFFRETVKQWSGFRKTEWHVIEGNLSVTDPLFFAAHEYICILGDLEVAGSILTGASGCKVYAGTERPERFDDSFLIVLGAVRCRNLYNGAANTLLINGPLTVDEVLYTSTQDSVCMLFGDLQARYVHSTGGWLTLCQGCRRAEIEQWSNYIELNRLPKENLVRGGTFLKQPLNGILETQAAGRVHKILAQGEPLLRGEATK